MLYIVIGPPAAGKTTYVRDHAQIGDITIDLDSLVAVLTPGEITSYVKGVGIQARQAAIDAALQLKDLVDVYVIHSVPSDRQLDFYKCQGAQVITIDPGKSVVLERCRVERSDAAREVAKNWYKWVKPDW